MEELIKETASRNIKSAKDRFNVIVDNDISKLGGLKKYVKSQTKILYIFRLLK